jgi:hypothetical protein
MSMERPPFKLILFLTASLILAVMPILFTGAARAEQKLPHKVETAPSERMEFPENPPLPPARPVPGAPRSAPVVYGRHVSIQVNVDANGANIPGDAANEPTLAVDPTNPLRMIIGWRQFDNVQSNFRQAGYAYTTDEGRTWTFPGVLTPGVFRSDPVLSADADGRIGYLSLEESFNTDYFKTTNHGLSWLPSVPAYGGDKEWLTNDRTNGIGHNNAYSFWTGNSNVFTRSTNDGNSFNPPSNIPSNPHWGTMDVGPDGVLNLIGVDANYSGYLYSKSIDAQDPNDTSTSFTTIPVNLGGTVNYFTGPNPEGLLGQPWIAVDPSNGITRGYIYVVASVDPAGADPVDIHFIRSTDQGATWSTPVQINDDLGMNAWQWFGTMSVAPNGRIDVVWNDTRDTGQTNRSALYYSYSTNGGMSWSANERLSPIWDSFVGWPNQDKIGDYYQMTSDRVGANLAWAATFNNEEDVYYMRIGDYDCNGNGVGDSLDIATGYSRDDNHNGIPDSCEGYIDQVAQGPSLSSSSLSNSPNPFAPSTTIQFEMPPEGGHARISIYNVGGQLVRTLLDAEAHGGTNSLIWDGTDNQGRSVPAGAYLYQLVRPGEQTTRRMLLLKGPEREADERD